MKYYSALRPITPGAYPKSGKVISIENFADKTYCESIGREAWGCIEYEQAIPEQDAAEYELIPEGQKLWHAVTSAFYGNGKTIAHITGTKEAAEKPESTFKATSRKDIYIDWFESREAAEEFIRTVK